MLNYGPPKRIGIKFSIHGDHTDKKEGDKQTSHVNVTKILTFILFIMLVEYVICFGEASSSSSSQSAPLTPKASPNNKKLKESLQ